MVDFAELLSIAERIGFPTLALMAGVWIGIKFFGSSLEDHSTIRKSYQDLQIKYYEALADNKVLVKQIDDCQTEKGQWESRLLVLEVKNQHAVDRFLDDTQDFMQEVDRVMLINSSLMRQLKEYELTLDARNKELESLKSGNQLGTVFDL